MFKIFRKLSCEHKLVNYRKISQKSFPTEADVVVIGGGSAGCHTLYHLAKKGVKCVLLERSKLTAGTTWHTAGLIWSLRPNDVDTQLLARSRTLLENLEHDTGMNPGWTQNGGIFIAHTKNRLDEYKRLSSIGNCLEIENYILTPEETQKLFPLLNKDSFLGALYSPSDGTVDPTLLCTALTRGAIANGAKVIEHCPVLDILVESTPFVKRKIMGVSTPHGVIKTNNVINATGVWGNNLVKKHGVNLPLIPMRHAYIVSESIPEVRGLPNIRDHDYSIYFRIQGESLCMGGYENNPIFLDDVPSDFNFGLYDLDWSIFNTHIQGTIDICPIFEKCGIKHTICGPESFTPDHKPLMGPDPNVLGLFHNCGFNSAGMMFGGGCGEQIAAWVTNGKPDLHMFQFDVRRFSLQQNENLNWIRERSHESYAKNYSMVFPHDQPLAGRNLILDPLHENMISHGAVMEEKQGWERPGFFLPGQKVLVQAYDWYGNYGHKTNKDESYKNILEGDLRYEFSQYHDLIGQEALACRKNAVVFNMSYFCKMFLEGPECDKAARWIFSAKTDESINRTVYTCVLNDYGGVESDVTVTRILPSNDDVHDSKFDGSCYYIVAGGASAYYTYSTILSIIREKGFDAYLRDVTSELGVISIQGPKSQEILQRITNCDLSKILQQPYDSQIVTIRDKSGKNYYSVRVLRISFVGELGYELHVPKDYCSYIYDSLMLAGKSDDLRNAGYRALYSLSSEKGYHLWGFDLRSDDSPAEANLLFCCRKNENYKGKTAVDEQRKHGYFKRLVYLLPKEQIPIWGFEGVYRNGEPAGYLRRGEYAYFLGKSIGQAYIERKDGKAIDAEFLKSGKYQVDLMGTLHDVDCYLKSPFDPQNLRISGIYE